MRERLAKRREKVGEANIIPSGKPIQINEEDLADLAVMGAERMLAGATQFQQWSDQMMNSVGDIIRMVAEDAGATPLQVIRLVHEYAREVAAAHNVEAESSTPVAAEQHSELDAEAAAIADAMRDRRAKRSEKLGESSIVRPLAPEEINADDLIDLTKIGATRILAGALKFEDWSNRMMNLIGDLILGVAEDTGSTPAQVLRLVHKHAREVAQAYGVEAESTPAGPQVVDQENADSYVKIPGGLRQIGPYQVQGELGASNMAVVYRAFDPVVDRTLAVKVLRIPSPAAEGEIAEGRLRFENEVQTLSRLSPHDNIPVLYYFGEDGDFPYFAMELVPGESLDKKISGGKALLPADAVPIIRQIACVLDYAHGKGIVHRDIKPGNVLVQPNGRVKIIDFGIALVGSQNLTATGTRLGTPAYMSPEQIKGEDVQGPSDQFSLAVLAYRALTGRMPFEGKGELEHYNILHSNPPPASRVNPALSARLDEVLQRALTKAQGDRFETCGEFAAALDKALRGSSEPDPADATRRTSVSFSRSSRTLKVALVGVICLAAVAGLATWTRTIDYDALAAKFGGKDYVHTPGNNGEPKLRAAPSGYQVARIGQFAGCKSATS